MVQLTTRDIDVVRFVGDFGQVTSGHIRERFFYDLLSDTPCKRRLRRLTEAGLLRFIERRPIGGAARGSGQAVYQLGPKGWELCYRDGRYRPFRAISHHRLAITDAHVAIKALERTGRYEIIRDNTEPQSHQEIAGVELTPDYDVELRDRALGEDYLWWLEIDMGTERQAAIKDKLARYYQAYENVDTAKMPDWPHIVFLVPDELRATDIRRWIAQGPADAQHLFRVELQTSFPQALMAM